MTMSNKESRRLYSGGQMRPITPPFPITFTFFFLADAFLSKRFARGCVRCIGTKGSVFVCRLNMQWSAGVRMSLSVIKHMPCEHVLPITDFMVCVCVWAYVCVVALRICAWNYTLVGKAKCPLASVCLSMCVCWGVYGRKLTAGRVYQCPWRLCWCAQCVSGFFSGTQCVWGQARCGVKACVCDWLRECNLMCVLIFIPSWQCGYVDETSQKICSVPERHFLWISLHWKKWNVHVI